MLSINYNPDVLSCLANLSNDEVFTPPKLVNEILDMLPQELFESKESTFLDPVTKSGVFLREIAKRLNDGLKDQIPDQQERVNHILTKQVYGIAITELTSLLARRSTYCAKKANGKYSVCTDFKTEQGNIKYERLQHTWASTGSANGKCVYCGASKEVYDRIDDLETYAYQFIHTDKPKKIFKNMKFDVIVGNPPYQLSDGGHGASAKPIYHKFIKQALKLKPRFVSMITPSRWFAGGRVGELSEFRKEMLKDRRVRQIHDFKNASDCFPGVEIKGGVNYFLWNRDNPGKCKVFNYTDGKISVASRELMEQGSSIFIRSNNAIPILQKVLNFDEKSFSELVSANDPFGFDVREVNSMKRIKPKYNLDNFKNSVYFYYNGWKTKGLGNIDRKYIKKNDQWLNENKIFVPKAIGSGDSQTDIIKPIVPKLGSCCSETYLVIGPFLSEQVIQNVLSYINTKFFHFMVSIKKITQESRRGVYQYVPMQDFSIAWNDTILFQKYKFTKEEIDYVNSSVRDLS